MSYQRASFEPLRQSGYGIGFHWTTWNWPREGEPVSFEEAVETFDVAAFVEQAVEAGAGHVLITTTHEKHHLAGPNSEVDRILSGRTSKRDLLMEIADGLAAANIRLMLYYHHGCGEPTQDTDWQDAMGSKKLDQTDFYDRYCRILGWMGEHYGPKAIAWWFDAGYSLMARSAPPFARMTAAAKAGHPDRLVAYNAGIEEHTLYTVCQDYWAGEMNRLNYVPRGKLTPAGLPWYSLTSWHAHHEMPMCGGWNIDAETRDLDWPPPPVEAVAAYLRRFQAVGGTVTFNLLCHQDGSALDTDLAVMKQLKGIMR